MCMRYIVTNDNDTFLSFQQIHGSGVGPCELWHWVLCNRTLSHPTNPPASTSITNQSKYNAMYWWFCNKRVIRGSRGDENVKGGMQMHTYSMLYEDRRQKKLGNFDWFYACSCTWLKKIVLVFIQNCSHSTGSCRHTLRLMFPVIVVYFSRGLFKKIHVVYLKPKNTSYHPVGTWQALSIIHISRPFMPVRSSLKHRWDCKLSTIIQHDEPLGWWVH